MKLDSTEASATQGADFTLCEHFLSPSDADEQLKSLLQETPWREEDVFVWGKWRKQPRLTAWYGDADAIYTYSSRTLVPLEWTPRLSQLRDAVSALCGVDFNGVLLNLYRDGNDSMGWHSDNEPELGPRPTIASMSLGAPRDLLFKHRDRAIKGTRRVRLGHGSLLVMTGNSQSDWLHAINKAPRLTDKRINLTFRVVSAKRAPRVSQRS